MECENMLLNVILIHLAIGMWLITWIADNSKMAGEIANNVVIVTQPVMLISVILIQIKIGMWIANNVGRSHGSHPFVGIVYFSTAIILKHLSMNGIVNTTPGTWLARIYLGLYVTSLVFFFTTNAKIE